MHPERAKLHTECSKHPQSRTPAQVQSGRVASTLSILRVLVSFSRPSRLCILLLADARLRDAHPIILRRAAPACSPRNQRSEIEDSLNRSPSSLQVLATRRADRQLRNLIFPNHHHIAKSSVSPSALP